MKYSSFEECVPGDLASSIHGELAANGRVFLIHSGVAGDPMTRLLQLSEAGEFISHRTSIAAAESRAWRAASG